MAQPFSFGFSGDDIEVDADVDQGAPAVAPTAAAASAQPHVPAQTHSVAELVCLLLSAICAIFVQNSLRPISFLPSLFALIRRFSPF